MMSHVQVGSGHFDEWYVDAQVACWSIGCWIHPVLYWLKLKKPAGYPGDRHWFLLVSIAGLLGQQIKHIRKIYS